MSNKPQKENKFKERIKNSTTWLIKNYKIIGVIGVIFTILTFFKPGSQIFIIDGDDVAPKTTIASTQTEETNIISIGSRGNKKNSTNTPVPNLIAPSLTPTPIVLIETDDFYLEISQNGFCRIGPNISHQIIGYVFEGEKLNVNGRSSDNYWWWVEVKESDLSCWIGNALADLDFDVEKLVVLTPIPLPTETEDNNYSSGNPSPPGDPGMTSPSISLIDSPDPSNNGQNVTFTVTMNGGGLTPTGQVTLTKDTGGSSSPLCIIVLSNGSGNCSATFFADNTTYNVNAYYSGDSNYNSVSSSFSHSTN